MGTWFQTLADIDATIEEAPLAAAEIRDWLIEQKVIDPTPRHCVLDKNRVGYAPLNYERVVDKPAGSDSDVRQLAVNGFEIEIGRKVFHTGQSGVTITCPACGAQCSDNWAEAISEWLEAKSAGLLKCANCENESSITTWTFVPAWGFGNLGFTFWNWPPLKSSFLDEVRGRLAHRTVFIADKL
jgi:hypothetical protein